MHGSLDAVTYVTGIKKKVQGSITYPYRIRTLILKLFFKGASLVSIPSESSISSTTPSSQLPVKPADVAPLQSAVSESQRGGGRPRLFWPKLSSEESSVAVKPAGPTSEIVGQLESGARQEVREVEVSPGLSQLAFPNFPDTGAPHFSGLAQSIPTELPRCLYFNE
jgi:hypothetical protein